MTYEEDLDALWATYGPEVDSVDVPLLVLRGVEVFSFGYGSDDALEEGFDCLDRSDLWAWDEAPDVVKSWAPFRLANPEWGPAEDDEPQDESQAPTGSAIPTSRWMA